MWAEAAVRNASNPASQLFADGPHPFVWLLNLSREAQEANSAEPGLLGAEEEAGIFLLKFWCI